MNGRAFDVDGVAPCGRFSAGIDKGQAYAENHDHDQAQKGEKLGVREVFQVGGGDDLRVDDEAEKARYASESTGLRQAFAKRGPTAGFLKRWIRDICWNAIFLLLTDL